MTTKQIEKWEYTQRFNFNKNQLEYWKVSLLNNAGFDLNKQRNRRKRDSILPFEQAKKIVHSLKLRTNKEWYKWFRKNRPSNLPCNPQQFYKEWISFGDWLGNGFVATMLREYLPFNKARAFVHKLKFKSRRKYFAWWKINRPTNIPRNPNKVYKNKFKGYGDWIGK